MYIGVAGRFLWMTPNDSHPLCNILFLECVWNLWIRWPVTPVIMLHYMSRGTSSERASSNHVSPLKAEFYSSKVKEKVAEEEVRDSRHRGVLRCRCWLQRWRGPHARECRGSLEIVSSPQLAASKEMKTSNLQLQRTEFCQQSERVWKRILLLSFQIRVQLGQHLGSELVRPQAENPV